MAATKGPFITWLSLPGPCCQIPHVVLANTVEGVQLSARMPPAFGNTHIVDYRSEGPGGQWVVVSTVFTNWKQLAHTTVPGLNMDC